MGLSPLILQEWFGDPMATAWAEAQPVTAPISTWAPMSASRQHREAGGYREAPSCGIPEVPTLPSPYEVWKDPGLVRNHPTVAVTVTVSRVFV